MYFNSGKLNTGSYTMTNGLVQISFTLCCQNPKTERCNKYTRHEGEADNFLRLK